MKFKYLVILSILTFCLSSPAQSQDNSYSTESSTAVLLQQASDNYEKGNLAEAEKLIDKALQKDSDNEVLKDTAVTILTELGIEYSFKDDYESALEYYLRAQEIRPNNKDIKDFIETTRQFMGEDVSATEDTRTPEDMENILEAFKEYRQRQEQLLEKYDETRVQMQHSLGETLQEKQTVEEKLQEREKQLEEALTEKKETRRLWLGVIIGVVLIAGGGFIILYKKLTKDKEIAVSKKIEEEEKNPEETEYERKMKKIEIIENELTTENPYENQVALNMVEQFLDDEDYRIRLRIIEVIHKIDPDSATEILKDIIKEETGQFRDGACKLLGDLISEKNIKLLLQLVENREYLREVLYEPLVHAATQLDNDRELKSEIKAKLKKYYPDREWVA
ncbi:MAG: HEAT repeat domain-containing protein [Elusimicrobiota bacterium]